MVQHSRVLACVTAIVFAGTARSTVQERRLEQAEGLQQFVHAERLAQQLPGLAAVVVRSDDTPRIYVSGERRIGKGDLITAADRMHLGSLTKSITATLVGALAEKGLMTLDTTIGQAFPELSSKIQPAYRQVSIRQLLSHSAGIGTYGTNISLLPFLGLNGTPTEQRYAFVQRVLAEPPRFDPGSRSEYSNAGAAIVGAMAERIAGAPYRELVERLVFERIGARVAFGNPGLAVEPQPWGHRRIFGGVAEVPPAAPLYTTPLAIEPAGDASPSLSDCARFLQLHLRGLRGRDDGLRARTIQELQGRFPDRSQRGRAVAWNVLPRDSVESHEHFGSSGAYVAYATIQPSRDVAVGVFTNLGGDQELRAAIASIALRIAARYSVDEKH
jgi:CubicO group peptidase (beta-lactamase class C family)